MGKNKTRNNVFKVAGARSLKAKNKAKAVTVQLKKISQNVKNQTEQINKELESLENVVRQTVPPPSPACLKTQKKVNVIKKILEAKKQKEMVNQHIYEQEKAEATLAMFDDICL